MIVDKFDVVGIIAAPAKAKPPLTVDTNAELSSVVSLQGFQSIARRRAQIVQSPCGMELLHLCKLGGEAG